MVGNRRRKQFRTIYRAIVAFYVLAGIFLLPVTGFCVETDTKEIIEKAAQNAPWKTVAKAEFKSRRPDQEKGATKVYFMMFVVDIASINAANQNFAINIFLRLRWKDRRLANPQESTRQIPLAEVWSPQVFIANRQGVISKSLPEVVQIDPDGTVTYRQRYTGRLAQPLTLTNFPMDKHTFAIHFLSAGGHGPDELEFLPGTLQSDSALTGGAIAKGLSLPDWKLLGYETLALPYQPIKEVNVAGFALHFEAERYATYYIWQVLLTMVLIVVMSWTAFWVQRDHVGVRIGITTSSMLTMIAHRFILASQLPRLSYMTRMDYFTVGSTFLVFLALVVAVAISYLSTINRNQTAKRMDLWARGAFPVVFLLLLGWFLFWWF